MRRLSLKLLLATTLFAAACVTINVYFPAAAADRAADQVINDITKGAVGAPPQSNFLPAHDEPHALLVAFGRLLDAAVPAAHAQGADALNVSSPAITRITASMAKRFGQLEKYFASGAVGLTNDGNIDVRDLNAVALPERATVKRLVAEDNADRAQLYAEIAKANNHPEWETDVRKSFARRWVATGAKSGWYYQDDGGTWKQK